eukprot:3284372-Prymnesium_polylepis.1
MLWTSSARVVLASSANICSSTSTLSRGCTTKRRSLSKFVKRSASVCTCSCVMSSRACWTRGARGKR